jgi:hypothetical protein
MPVSVGMHHFIPHRGLLRGIQTQLRNPARLHTRDRYGQGYEKRRCGE